ncbi:hypothetical protein HK100_006166 [Physocladia obscura]|uniref:FAD-binding domain-containing protein n=1 Tax=Physocladia obscura TaxID=109957 RepID=A0AAD5T5I6_9FUNG|nr:hypothetical protein HK100_006166 [Physocladia obscura]
MNRTVAIIGGGPAGLCLARILQTNAVSVKVYELEESRNSRPQGGYLDLHEETGQRAIREANLYAEFRANLQPGADRMNVMDETGNLLYQDLGDGAIPEIERQDLKGILLDALEPNTVEWDHKLEKVDSPATDSEQIRLNFSGGKTAEAYIVVGADGAWSKVRNVLSELKPMFTGVSLVDAILSPSFKPTGNLPLGALIASDKNSNLLMGFLGPSSRMYFSTKALTPEEVTVASAKKFIAGWHEDFQVLADSIQNATVRHIFALPPKMNWHRSSDASESWKSRLTVIGDAAHVMSPFAGEGANLALADATDLANSIISALASEDPLTALKSQIENFEQVMWDRAEKAAEMSAQNLNSMFSGGSAAVIAELMFKYSAVRKRTVLKYYKQPQ